jgi:putative ABC transport system substrate-binding protein
MNRRKFITLVAGAAAWPLSSRAQQSAMPILGFVHVGSREGFGHLAIAFRRGLAEVEFVEGRNVMIENRWAEGQVDRLPALVAELLGRQVAVVVGPRQVAEAVKSARITTPVVFISGEDPLKLGLIESLNRPDGNMTGIYMFATGLEAKRLGLLRDAVPKAATIGVLIDANYSAADSQNRDVQEAAARLGVQIVVMRADPSSGFEPAFAVFAKRGIAALQVCASPFFNNRRNQLVALAARHKLPAVYEWREYAAAGGLLTYGVSITDTYRQAGLYAGRILKGAKPAELPVVQPTKFELVINAKTAKALGLTFSDNFLLLADEVIE